jgi:ABC-type dipeptide/oligopeptide/nickel transport system permease subunit
VVRAEVLALREATFVKAAIAIGNPPWRIMLIHILPNAILGATAQLPMRMAWAVRISATLAFIGVGPAVLSYSAWGAGVALVGPSVAGFFMNLIPLFAALLSTIFLGETPELFHALAFVLIVSGIVLSSQRQSTAKA